MAQNAYPAHMYQQRTAYPQPNPAAPYPPQSYPQPNAYQYPTPADTQQRYAPGPSQQHYPPLQTQFPTRPPPGPPSPYSPGQPPVQQGPLQYHQPQPVVAASPSYITPRHATNAYPSPVSPANPPSSFRRPLPNPGSFARPGSAAQAEGASAAMATQSRPPGHHRPSSSLSIPSTASSSQVAAAISKFSSMSVNTPGLPQGTAPIPVPSATPGRPLPQPGTRSNRSVDLTNGGSPSKQPQVTQQVAGSSSSGSSMQSLQHDLPPAGQKFVPLWKRALPSPAVQSAPNTPAVQHHAPQSVPNVPPGPGPLPNTIPDPRAKPQPQSTAISRRATTSRPLPQSPGLPPQPGPSRGSLPNINTHGQLPKPPGLPNQSPISIPYQGPTSINANSNQMEKSVIPTHSPFMRRERSRTLPQPGVASPAQPPVSRPAPVGRSARTPSMSSDDDLSGISLLQRRSIHKGSDGVDLMQSPKTPSPKYGIRDLPSHSPHTTPRSHQVGSSNHVRAPSSPTRQPPPLPARRDPSPSRSVYAGPKETMSHNQPISSSPERVPTLIHEPSERQSSIYKYAVMDVLGIKSPENQTKSTSQSNPLPPMRKSQTDQPRWPDDVPKLPKPPTQSMSTPGSSSRSTSPSRSTQIRSDPPPRNHSLNHPISNTVASSKDRPSRSNHRLPPNLDDAPPPSLRRSPSPSPDTQRRGHSGLPNIRTQSYDSWTSPTSSYSRTPSSAVTPDSAASFVSLSQFPSVPTHAPQPRPPQINISGLPQTSRAPPTPQVSVSQPPNNVQTVSKTNKGGPRTSPGRKPHSPKRETNGRPSIPKISFPADPNDSDDSDGPQPVINISGTTEDFSNPVISVGNFDDDDDGQFPGISISVADDSASGEAPQVRKPPRELPPPASVLGKGGRFCGGCGGTIIGRIVSAMGERWHPMCFKCVVCDEHLENLSSYEHEGRPYCHLDYHEVSQSHS